MGNFRSNRQGTRVTASPRTEAAKLDGTVKPLRIATRLASSAVLAASLAACTITPRTGAPASISKTHKGLQAAVDCVLAQLNASMAKGPPPNFTHVVSIVTPGQVEEIIPKQFPSGSGELYVVRFTAEDDGTTNIVLFSTLNGLDKRVEQAMAPCLEKSNAPAKSKAQ
jgi:hypothetical protein